jgi:aminoglycoside phosphotransferase (APT) family kinase protein
VLELVGLHQPSWCDSTLRGIDWLGEPDPTQREWVRGLYREHIGPFLARYGSRLAPDEARIIERFASASDVSPGLPQPFSLVHIDYRLDNLLIDERPAVPRVAVVDWQSITLGSPLGDVAYFLGAGLLPEARRPVEHEIVRAYHDALRDRGIEHYSWQECLTDYRRGAFAGFSVTVIASMIVQQTPRGDEMFVAMARRHSRHALDLGAEEFLA